VLEDAPDFGIYLDINWLLNQMKADHLDEYIVYWIESRPRLATSYGVI
jgi:hypothetical protein